MAHPKRSPLTAATITPPALNRQHSHTSKLQTPKSTNTSSTSSTATTVLANVASRTTSPRRTHSTPSYSQSSPGTSPTLSTGSRSSWKECTEQRDGYISFPDFDQLRAEREYEGRRTGT